MKSRLPVLWSTPDVQERSVRFRFFNRWLVLLSLLFFSMLLVALVAWQWDLRSPDEESLQAPLFAANTGSSSSVVLTADELAYLEALGPITVAPDPDWVPYEHVDSHGNFTGIAADLLALVELRLGIEFTYVFPGEWDQILEESRAGNVLILPFLNQTPARDEWLLFTKPLFIDPSVFVTREEHPYIFDVEQLTDRSIVFPLGTSLEERVRRDFPNLDIIHVANENEVFRAVANRTADMALRPLTIAAYTIRKEGLFTLKVAGQAPDNYINRLRMGVLKEHEVLRDILNRGIATITHREREEIVNRHVNITIVQPFDYTFLLRMGGFLFLLIGLSYYWNFRLSQLNAELEESERSKAVLLANLPGIAYRCRQDANWTMEFMSNGTKSLTGYSVEDLVDNRKMPFNQLIHPDDQAMVRKVWDAAIESRTAAQMEYRIQTRDSETRWVFEQGVVVSETNAHPIIMEGLIIDITDRKKAEQELYEVSINDSLTGIFNRRYIYQRLEQMLVQASRDNKPFCVAIIDLDHFKKINDTYGHLVGDEVLRDFAQILKASLRSYDLVGRFGGEEFIVVTAGVNNEMAAQLLERLLLELRGKKFTANGAEFVVTFSAGVACIQEPGLALELDAAIARADARLYSAKHAGRNQVVAL